MKDKQEQTGPVVFPKPNTLNSLIFVQKNPTRF